jgi:hypothetical protein
MKVDLVYTVNTTVNSKQAANVKFGSMHAFDILFGVRKVGFAKLENLNMYICICDVKTLV